ncbi:MAG: amidohydrolase [Thermoanaerobaculales bacterium]|nr:amidohydrolase [Thermoanaerobaculales bacterium]
MKRRHDTMTRAEFVKRTAGAVGGMALAGSAMGDLFALSPQRGFRAAALPLGTAADTVLLNGKVATVDAFDSFTQAVAIRDGLILQTGSTANIQALAGEGTLVIDLKGRTLTPGFIDAHCHFQYKALMGDFWLGFVPPEVGSITELQDAVADLVTGMEMDEWVNGYYLVFSDGRSPTRDDLDPVSPDNPVFIMHQGGHWASVNSLALAMAGITSDTPDPVGGIIERDSGGEPTGVLYNHRAMDLVRHLIPLYSNEDLVTGILATQPLFAAAGLTGFHDNNIRDVEGLRTYQRLASNGQVYQRQGLFYTLEWPSDLDRALHEIDHVTNEFTRFAGFKFLIDGQGPTFYCHEAHGGTSYRITTWDPSTFKETVRILHETGLQICVHCGGDAAADLALDAFEEAMNAYPRSDPRHRIEHAVLTTPEATQRMVDLGVIVSTQPQFIRLAGDLYKDLFTANQMERLIMTREWLDAGVKVALGSDTPTTLWYEPRATLFGAMTRLTWTDQVLNPEQVMTVDEAIRAHTADAAFALHEEDVKGSIEAGKMADLVVWSDDPYSATAEEVYRSAIDLTMVGGEIVYLGPRPPRRQIG